MLSQNHGHLHPLLTGILSQISCTLIYVSLMLGQHRMTMARNLRYRYWDEFRDLILNLCSVMNPHLPTQIASIDLICFLYHTDEIFQTCVSYTNLFKILAHYLQTVYILEMTSDVLDNLNHQIVQYHDVKMSNLENFILTELYIVGTSFPRVLKMQAHYLVLRKA